METEELAAVEEILSAESIAGGFLGASLAIILLITGIFYVLRVIAYWKIFTKAGKPGWHSIIPLLNQWDEIDLAWDRHMAWIYIVLSIAVSVFSSIYSTYQEAGTAPMALNIALLCFGCALTIISVFQCYKLAKAFGKGIGFFLGLIVLNPIFMIILGFGSAQYQKLSDSDEFEEDFNAEG